MIFKEISAEEFLKYAKNSPQFTFHQTPNWAKLKSFTNWESYYVGLFEDDKCLACSMILAKTLPYIKKKMFYAPRGFIADYTNITVLKTFTEELKKFVKNKKAIFVKIDPYIPYKQRDKEGNLVVGGYDNSICVDNLIKCGYRHKGFNKYFENIQPRWIMCVDLENKTYEDIEKDFMSTLRKELRQTVKNGIYTREMTRDELSEFITLSDSTGQRKGFETRPLSYYEKMWDALYKDDYMKASITKMNFDLAIENNQALIDEILKARKENEEKAKQGLIKINEKKALVKQKEEDTAITNYQKNIEKFKVLKEKYGSEKTVSALLYMESPDELLSLVIGNDADFMRYNPSFSCYKWGIEYALNHNKKRFNFYGITGNFSKDNPHYGLFEMKQRFGGHVVELIGEFDLVISPFWLFAYNTAIAIRSKLRH